MKFYLDTEFLEGTQAKKFLGFTYGQTKPTIDLISIGMVSEDGRTYYAVSDEFNLEEAWNRYDVVKDYGKPQGLGDTKVYWIRENVLRPVWNHLLDMYLQENMTPDEHIDFNFYSFKELVGMYGKSLEEIKKEVLEFVSGYHLNENTFIFNGPPEFYGYYADYDWVAFCWIFGILINRPAGFPMYCKDVKQMLDENGLDKEWREKNVIIPKGATALGPHHALGDAMEAKAIHEAIVKHLKNRVSYFKNNGKSKTAV